MLPVTIAADVDDAEYAQLAAVRDRPPSIVNIPPKVANVFRAWRDLKIPSSQTAVFDAIALIGGSVMPIQFTQQIQYDGRIESSEIEGFRVTLPGLNPVDITRFNNHHKISLHQWRFTGPDDRRDGEKPSRWSPKWAEPALIPASDYDKMRETLRTMSAAALGGWTFEEARLANAIETRRTKRYVALSQHSMGVCQVCFESHTITSKGLVFQHGYDRPGTGMNESPCIGSIGMSGILPRPYYSANRRHVRSCALSRAVLGELQKERDGHVSLIQRIERRDLGIALGRYPVALDSMRTQPRAIEFVTLTHPDWDTVSVDRIRELRLLIPALERTIAFIEKKVAEFDPGSW